MQRYDSEQGNDCLPFKSLLLECISHGVIGRWVLMNPIFFFFGLCFEIERGWKRNLCWLSSTVVVLLIPLLPHTFCAHPLLCVLSPPVLLALPPCPSLLPPQYLLLTLFPCLPALFSLKRNTLRVRMNGISCFCVSPDLMIVFLY